MKPLQPEPAEPAEQAEQRRPQESYSDTILSDLDAAGLAAREPRHGPSAPPSTSGAPSLSTPPRRRPGPQHAPRRTDPRAGSPRVKRRGVLVYKNSALPSGEACAERGTSPEGPQLRGTSRPVEVRRKRSLPARSSLRRRAPSRLTDDPAAYPLDNPSGRDTLSQSGQAPAPYKCGDSDPAATCCPDWRAERCPANGPFRRTQRHRFPLSVDRFSSRRRRRLT